MDLISLCPFPIAAFPWQPRLGEWNLSVCVKATFALVHGQEAQIAAVQQAIGDDAYWDDNPGASLYTAGDFVPYKPRVDVLLVGHAYAPGGAPVESLTVRLQVGSLVKELTISGDRAWEQGRTGVRAGPPAPFRKMALRYERGALAGENAIGVDDAAHSVEVGRPLPNIDASSSQTPGFGPVPLLWRARRRQLADAAVLWAYRLRLASGAMPPGFDFNLFNAAPAEQQISSLPPRASIVLEHLSPHAPRLESRLPGLAPKLFRRGRDDGRATPVALRADTLWIDADRALAVVSWRGLTPIPGPSDEEIGQLIVVVEAEGERVRSEEIDRLALTASGHRGPPTLAAAPSVGSANVGAISSLAPAEPSPAVEVIEEPITFTEPDVTQAVRVGTPLRVALPFQADPVAAPSPQRASSADLSRPQALPFKLAVPAAPPLTVSAPAPSDPDTESEASIDLDEDATRPINLKALNIPALLAARLGQPEKVPVAGRPPMQAPERQPVVPPPPPLGASLFRATEPNAPPAEAAKPPPLLGAPLFDAGARSSSEALEAPSAPGAPADRRSLASIDPDAVPVERGALIAAEIAEKRATRDEVLTAHGLTAEAWALIEDQWAKAMAAEAKRGSGKVTDAYDTAYVAAVESFRGQVTAEEYGRLLQAMKAGKVNQALDELRIQRAAMPRLMRVWTKRLAEDPQLLRKVQGVSGAGTR